MGNCLSLEEDDQRRSGGDGGADADGGADRVDARSNGAARGRDASARGALSSWPGGGVALPPEFELRPPPTRARLATMRDEFFHTRTEGSVDMWNAIRAASEAFRAGDASLGNEIVLASGLSPAEIAADGAGVGARLAKPSDEGEGEGEASASQPPRTAWIAGMMGGARNKRETTLRTLERVYDERGYLYETPRECLVDPKRVAEDAKRVDGGQRQRD